jgi:hypothetical protein
MATRKALVDIGGHPTQIPPGDTLDVGAGITPAPPPPVDNDAVVFSPVPTTPSTNIISARSAHQSPVAGGVVGATCLGSDTSGATPGVSANYGSVLGGDQCTAEATHAVACGGFQNNGQGVHSFVGAGSGNRAQQTDSGVVCGNSNTAAGVRSCVGGGFNCQALGARSFVGGGDSNATPGADSCVPAGVNCTTNGATSCATGDHCTTGAQAPGSFAHGIGAVASRLGQRAIACGPIPGPAIAPQSSVVVLRANSPDAASTHLLKSGAANPAAVNFILEPNTSYSVAVTLVIRRALNGDTFTQVATVSCHGDGGGNAVIDGVPFGTSAGGAVALAGSALTFAPVGNNLGITYSSGLAEATDASARVVFTEVTTGANA